MDNTLAHNDQDIVVKAREFCAEYLQPLAKELDQQNRFPTELLDLMSKQGFFGLNYPVEYGGGGYDSVVTQQVAKEIAKVSAGVALTMHVQWMAIDVLLRFGSEEQKQKYLPDMIQGKRIAAYTISEAQAGSDAAAIQAQATPDETGWSLKGAKFFSTNGGLADIYLVAVKTDAEAGAKGISMFILEKGMPGFHIGKNEEKMGCRSSVITSLVFDGCHVTPERLLGTVNTGFKIAMYGLVGGRLGMASMGLGIAEAAFEASAKYSNRRVVYGKPLSLLYSAQAMLAEMHVKIEAAKLLVFATAQKRDGGNDYALDTSVAKIFVADMVTEVCHKALQLLGGHGYMKYNDLERYARDARLMDIGVGASEVLKMVVGSAVAKSIGNSR